ncbi:MAG: metallophosphoesterase [Candidatus Helarchaeota archaeon]|nr:metallophosphoesterase [Candidatus Helarchaeota archaeon]
MKIIAFGDPHLGNTEKMVERFHYPPNYFEQLSHNLELETPIAELLIIAGDLVWGTDFSEAVDQLDALQTLKAKNISFIEGNHDWWLPQYSTMYAFFNSRSFYFLSGRTFILENVGICGIRGTDKEASTKTRELRLLENALTELSKAAINLVICVIHFPPTSLIFQNPDESFAEDNYFSLMEEFGVNKIVYGHCHADQNYRIKPYLKIDNIELYCTSLDYFNWSPVRIL